MIARRCFVLASLHHVVLPHLLIDLSLQGFEIYNLLVSILVEGGLVRLPGEAMHLQFLINHRLDLLHRLKDQIPRLHVKDMAQIVSNVEESLANEYVSLTHGVLDGLVRLISLLQRLPSGLISW